MLKDVPLAARVLGLSSLAPFAIGAVAIWSGDPVQESEALTLQLTYGAVTLSFLGGIHWSRAFAGDGGWRPLGWSAAPPLIAWITLRMYPVPALAVLIFAFALAFLVDYRAVKAGRFPQWYLPLRKVWTLGAIAGLGSCLVWAFARVNSLQ